MRFRPVYCALCLCNNVFAFPAFEAGGGTDELPWSRKSQEEISQNTAGSTNSSLVKRVAPELSPPFGSFPMYVKCFCRFDEHSALNTEDRMSASAGPVWQPQIDMHNRMFVRQFAAHSNLVPNRNGASLQDVMFQLGPLPVPIPGATDSWDIYYMISVRMYTAWTDVFAFLTWGIGSNYALLPLTGNQHQVWAHWRPSDVPEVPTPWLRTNSWLFNGWIRSASSENPDIEMFIFTVPKAAKVFDASRTLQQYLQGEQRMSGRARSPIFTALTKAMSPPDSRPFRPRMKVLH